MLWDDEAISHILLAKCKWDNCPRICPLYGAVSEICLQSECALIPLLGGLCQQLHDDVRERFGDCRIDLAGRDGQLRNLTVDQLECVIRMKRRAASQQLIEDDAEGIH